MVRFFFIWGMVRQNERQERKQRKRRGREEDRKVAQGTGRRVEPPKGVDPDVEDFFLFLQGGVPLLYIQTLALARTQSFHTGSSHKDKPEWRCWRRWGNPPWLGCHSSFSCVCPHCSPELALKPKEVSIPYSACSQQPVHKAMSHHNCFEAIIDEKETSPIVILVTGKWVCNMSL